MYITKKNEKTATIFPLEMGETSFPSCRPDQFACVTALNTSDSNLGNRNTERAKCISLDQLCDRHVDCSSRIDELYNLTCGISISIFFLKYFLYPTNLKNFLFFQIHTNELFPSATACGSATTKQTPRNGRW